MRDSSYFVALIAILKFSFFSPSEALPSYSPAFPLVNDFCSKFGSISLENPGPIDEVKNVLPETELKVEITKIKNNEYQDHFPDKSAFRLLQVLFPDLQPKETLKLEDLTSKKCDNCHSSKIDYFYGGCGSGVCSECHKKLHDAPCPVCHTLHQWVYPVSIYQLEKSSVPFVPVIPTPVKNNFAENIKNVHATLVTWSSLVDKYPSFFKLSQDNETPTARILQIFDIFQNYSLWKLTNPLLVLRWGLYCWKIALAALNPNQHQKLSMSTEETLEFEVLKQKFSEMENSFLLITYYIQWLINILDRECYSLSHLN